MKLRTFLINSLGSISTVAALAITYMVLWLEGYEKPLDMTAVTEFIIITGLCMYAKIFWYRHCEYKVRNHPDYLKDRQAFFDEIVEVVTDAKKFDTYIDNENIANYNRYVVSKCGYLTLTNYKLSFRDKLFKLFHPNTPKVYFFNRYIIKCERRGSRLNRLSAARILSGTECTLIDDRNFAGRDKARYMLFGTITSICMFALFAIINFRRRDDLDILVTITKMVTYTVSMLFSILLTVISATSNTKRDDYDYMRRIYNILDRYKQYLENPVSVTKVEYLLQPTEEELMDCEALSILMEGFKQSNMEVDNESVNSESSEEATPQRNCIIARPTEIRANE